MATRVQRGWSDTEAGLGSHGLRREVSVIVAMIAAVLVVVLLQQPAL